MIQEEGNPTLPDGNPVPARFPGDSPPGTVFDIIRFSVHDGPGIRTTVFLKGCPLQCAWCHNPESLSHRPELSVRAERCIRCGDCFTVCPHQAITEDHGEYTTRYERCAGCGSCADVCVGEARELIGKDMTVAEVLAEVEKDALFYEESGGGVTFSGGEPLLQHRFLVGILRACRERAFHTAVDTSGYATPMVLAAVAEFTDLFLYDLKSMNDVVHRKYTGVSGGLIRGNLRRLASWGKKVVVRMPVVTGVNDATADIEEAGRFIASLGNVVRVELLPYHMIGAEKYARLGMDYALPDVRMPTVEHMSLIAEILSRSISAVAIGG